MWSGDLSRRLIDTPVQQSSSAGERELTPRAIAAGLFIGTILCFTNMYFGLLTGWVTMGSVQSALIGYGLFQMPGLRNGRRFTRLENVVVQTISVATATLPLAGGFIGIIPALRSLNPPITLSVVEQLGWSAALTYIGIFFAVPLRRQTILVEQLAFPSGTATANLIDLLHTGASSPPPETSRTGDAPETWRALGFSFGASFGLAAMSALMLPKADPTLHVASWVGLPSLTEWRWTLRPALSLVGQGMIMGTRPAFSLLLGALTGWAVLGPLARMRGWASGPIWDMESGAQGWVLWVSVSLMLAEALTSLLLLVVLHPGCGKHPGGKHPGGKQHHGQHHGRQQARASDALEVAPSTQLVPTSWWVGGLLASLIGCVAVVSPLFGMGVVQVAIAAILSCVVAVLAVRALGQTDINPVAGIGKLSQLVFAIVAPGHIVANIVAGALAEAGATQAGDLLQGLKAAHLLRASPRAQFFGQLIGATASVFITVGCYQLYDRAYGVPSAQLPAPVAAVWKDMALLMQRGLDALPPSSLTFASAFGLLGFVLPVLEALGPPPIAQLLPSGMSVGVAMYLTPDFTIPRVFGAIAERCWRHNAPPSHRRHMLVVASGFVLGEGIWSMLALAVASAIAGT